MSQFGHVDALTKRLNVATCLHMNRSKKHRLKFFLLYYNDAFNAFFAWFLHFFGALAFAHLHILSALWVCLSTFEHVLHTIACFACIHMCLRFFVNSSTYLCLWIFSYLHTSTANMVKTNPEVLCYIWAQTLRQGIYKNFNFHPGLC